MKSSSNVDVVDNVVSEKPQKRQEGFLRSVIRGPWLKVPVFFLTCFLTSPIYYGWQQTSLMLGRSGAYEWLCNENDPPSGDFRCEAQDKAIGRLYSIAAGCEYASAAWGGYFLDSIGPRYGGLVGELVWGVGLLLLACSSQSFQAYIPAYIITGSSINVISFPSLTTLEIWPQWKGLLVGIMLAGASGAAIVPPVIWQLWNRHPNWTFRNIWLVYLAAIWFPISVLYVFALPSGRDYTKILALQRRELLAIGVKDENSSATGDQLADQATIASPQRTENDDSSNEPPPEQFDIRKATWREFFGNVRTIDMLLMLLWFLVMNCTYAYYPTVIRAAIGPRISDYLGWFMATQAVWALVVGVLCDYIRTPWIMMGMCSLVIVVYGISIDPDPLWAQYLAATIFVISQCAIFEVKFTFVAELFDPYHYGKLVGCLGVLGGVGTFINIPIGQQSAYKTIFTTWICVMPVLILIAFFLGWRQVKGQTYKVMPKVVEGNTADQKV